MIWVICIMYLIKDFIMNDIKVFVYVKDIDK